MTCNVLFVYLFVLGYLCVPCGIDSLVCTVVRICIFCVFIYSCKNLQYSSLIVNVSSLLDDKLHMLIVM